MGWNETLVAGKGIWNSVSIDIWGSRCELARMTVSPALQARRALVKLLLTLASLYSVVVDLHRDSCDADVSKQFKKVFLKAHPDKGGTEEHAKQLNAAKDKWEQAKKKCGEGSQKFTDLVAEEVSGSVFRVQSLGVMLTCIGCFA